jgi:hypothetical protein
MCSTGAEINRAAVAPIGDRHHKHTPPMPHRHPRSTWQPRVRGANAPVLVGAAAILRPPRIPRVIHRRGHWPRIHRRNNQLLQNRSKRNQRPLHHFTASAQNGARFDSPISRCSSRHTTFTTTPSVANGRFHSFPAFHRACSSSTSSMRVVNSESTQSNPAPQAAPSH